MVKCPNGMFIIFLTCNDYSLNSIIKQMYLPTQWSVILRNYYTIEWFPQF